MNMIVMSNGYRSPKVFTMITRTKRTKSMFLFNLSLLDIRYKSKVAKTIVDCLSLSLLIKTLFSLLF